MVLNGRKTRRNRGRRTYKRRGGMVNMIKRVINKESETKFSAPSTNIAIAGITTGGYVFNFHQSPYFVQGTFGQTGYIGSTVSNQRLRLSYYMQCGDQTNHMRIIIGWSKKTLTLADIALAVPTTLSPWRQTVKKAMILYDKLHMLDLGGDSGQKDHIIKRLSINLKGMKTTFEAGSGPNYTGHLFLYALSDSTGGANPYLDFNYVLSYKDF